MTLKSLNSLVQMTDGHWWNASDLIQHIKMLEFNQEHPSLWSPKMDDAAAKKSIAFYKSILSLVRTQESSDAEPSGTEAVLMDEEDNHIHYHIDEDGEVIIDKVIV